MMIKRAVVPRKDGETNRKYWIQINVLKRNEQHKQINIVLCENLLKHYGRNIDPHMMRIIEL